MVEDPFSTWSKHMRAGDFEAGWRISDCHLSRQDASCPEVPRHHRPVWDGTPLAGRRVLIRCYHGFGDTIQYLRFLPLAKAVASAVILFIQPQLIPLLDALQGRVDLVLPLHEGDTEAEYDVDVEIMELAHVFRVSAATIPAEVPYLQVPPAGMRKRERLGVGLVWRAGAWDPRRSIPFCRLRPLFDLQAIDWFTCQQDLRPWEEEGLTARRINQDLAGLASALRDLDLVVTVDTMVAHLAGALGLPVWTLLHADADWRWMLDREDSPWYPTMRLFRQNSPGDWEPVIRRVCAELEAISIGASSCVMRTPPPHLSLMRFDSPLLVHRGRPLKRKSTISTQGRRVPSPYGQGLTALRQRIRA
jgi:hypothetical protein